MLLLCDASSYFWTQGPVVCFSVYDLWPWFRWAAVIAPQHWFSLESLHRWRPGDRAEIQLAIKPSLSSYIMGLCQEVKTTVTLQKCLKRDRKSLTDCESVCHSESLSLCLKRLLFSDGRQEDGHDGVAPYSLYSGHSYGIFPASEVVQCSEDDSKETKCQGLHLFCRCMIRTDHFSVLHTLSVSINICKTDWIIMHHWLTDAFICLTINSLKKCYTTFYS